MELVIHLLVLVAIYSILSISLNIQVGTTGLFNLGMAAFYGVGAYTSAILALRGVPIWLSMLGAVIMSAFVGFLIGLPTLRLVGDYLAVATMGLGEIARAIFKNWDSMTRGVKGLPGIPQATLVGITFDSAPKFLALSLIMLVIVYVVAERWLSSPFGRVLKSIREDETAVQALGKNTFWFKMWALIIGSAMAGLAGSLFAHYINFIDPSSFVMWLTFFIFLIIMLGGLGNNLGAVIATVVFVAVRVSLRFVDLPEQLNPDALQQLIFGVLLIVATIYLPRGIIPEKKTVIEKPQTSGDG